MLLLQKELSKQDTFSVEELQKKIDVFLEKSKEMPGDELLKQMHYLTSQGAHLKIIARDFFKMIYKNES